MCNNSQSIGVCHQVMISFTSENFDDIIAEFYGFF